MRATRLTLQNVAGFLIDYPHRNPLPEGDGIMIMDS